MITAVQSTYIAPFLRLLTPPMPESNDPRETTVTTPAPPPSQTGDRETLPPDPVAEAGALKAMTMIPEAPVPPEYWKAAYDKLVEIHEEQRKDRADRQGRDDALVARLSEAAKKSSDENRENLTTALGEIARSVESIGSKLITLEENDAEHGERFAEGDERFGKIERAIAALKKEVLDALPEAMTAILAPYVKRLEDLEDEADKLRSNARPPTPTPTAG